MKVHGGLLAHGPLYLAHTYNRSIRSLLAEQRQEGEAQKREEEVTTARVRYDLMEAFEEVSMCVHVCVLPVRHGRVRQCLVARALHTTSGARVGPSVVLMGCLLGWSQEPFSCLFGTRIKC